MKTQALRARWAKLNGRERRLIQLAAAALVLGLALALVFDPAASARARLRGQLPTLRATLQEVEQARGEAERLRARARPGAGDSNAALRALTESAHHRGLSQCALTGAPDDAARLRVLCASAPLAPLLDWLRAAHTEWAWSTQSARLERLTDTDVKADIALSRGR